MKKVLLSLALGGLMMGASLASNALTFDVTFPSTTPGNNTLLSGVNTTDNAYTLTGTQIGETGDLADLPGSTFQFGNLVLTGGGASSTFGGVAASFSFDVTLFDDNGNLLATHSFEADGTIDGTTSGNASASSLNITSITQLDAPGGTSTTLFPGLTTSPVFGVDYIGLTGVDFAGVKGDVFVEASNAVPTLNPGVASTYGGFFRAAAVPEASTVAMFAGLSVSGLGLLRRRARRN